MIELSYNVLQISTQPKTWTNEYLYYFKTTTQSFKLFFDSYRNSQWSQQTEYSI